MKCFLFFWIICSFYASGQVLLMQEDFDIYNDQDYAGEVSPYIETWSGNVGYGTDDCLVTSSESSSANNSIVIEGPGAGGATDVLIAFPSDYTSGVFEFSMNMKVAQNKGAYFNVQGSSDQPGYAWMAQMYFSGDSTARLFAGGQNEYFTYPNGDWFEILLKVDIDSDSAWMYMNNNQVGNTWEWSSESTGAGNGTKYAFGGINLYALSGDQNYDCEYYIDDVLLVEKITAGVSELGKDEVSVYPNPSNGRIYLSSSKPFNGELEVRNALNHLLSTQKVVFVENDPYFLELKNAPGVYFLMIKEKGKLVDRLKLVIQ